MLCLTDLRRRRNRGFTFIEIMLVVLIIGILMAVVVPNMVGKTNKARITVCKQSMQAIKTALSNYELKAGSYPTTEQGLASLVKRPSDVSEDDWDGPYLEDAPKDPWGSEFVYRAPGENNRDYDLFSKGKDRQEGSDDDVTLRPKEESQ
jgi:general secretion pathway protein G